MAVLDAKKTYKNLQSKGFVKANTHHKYLEYFHNGKLVLHTRISHGETDLNDYLIRQMSSQCKLDKSNFMDLANCPLSQEAYFEILKSKGLIE
jgi:hypothetical protein